MVLLLCVVAVGGVLVVVGVGVVVGWLVGCCCSLCVFIIAYNNFSLMHSIFVVFGFDQVHGTNGM